MISDGKVVTTTTLPLTERIGLGHCCHFHWTPNPWHQYPADSEPSAVLISRCLCLNKFCSSTCHLLQGENFKDPPDQIMPVICCQESGRRSGGHLQFLKREMRFCLPSRFVQWLVLQRQKHVTSQMSVPGNSALCRCDDDLLLSLRNLQFTWTDSYTHKPKCNVLIYIVGHLTDYLMEESYLFKI